MRYRKGVLVVTEEPAIAEFGIHSRDTEIKSISVAELIAAPEPYHLLRGQKFDRVLLPEMLKEPWAVQSLAKVNQGITPTIMHHTDYRERVVYY